MRTHARTTHDVRPTAIPFIAMEVVHGWAELDDHLPPDVRTYLEERFWRPIEAQATLEVLRDDPAFLADPGHHPAMFADHGVVHVRDVATVSSAWWTRSTGVLLPAVRRRGGASSRRSASPRPTSTTSAWWT